jgi:hypothetical protein
VIVAATYFFLYRQVFLKRNLDEVYTVVLDFFYSPLFRQGVALLLLLMMINWGLESFKWNILIQRIEKVGLIKSFQAVLAGVSVSIFLPNRSGEYLGRVFILEKANRMEGVLITIIGSISQMIITISMGLFGFLAFYYQYMNKQSALHDYIGAGLILLVPIIVFSILLLYFNIHTVAPLLSRFFKGKWARYSHYAEIFKKYSSKDLFHVIVLSLIRYIVFSAQFYIFLRLFKVEVPFPEAMILISVIYLLMMVMPSIALTEIGIRGSLSVYMFSLYFQRAGILPDTYQLGIFAASSMLWLLNIVLPAIFGTFFVFNLKFFRK